MTIPILFLLFILGVVFAVFKQRKTSIILFISAVILYALIGSGLFASLLLSYLEKPYSLVANPVWSKKNAIVLLGGGVAKLPGEKIIPGTISFSRIYEATRLYSLCKKSNMQCLILISGGDAMHAGKSEAEIYKKAMLSLGVNTQDVLLEQRSLNTYQNAEFTGAMLKSMNIDKVFLVTSSVHMTRSLLYFSQFGVVPMPVIADYLSSYPSFIPLSYNFLLTDLALHEYLGIVRFKIYHYLGIKVKPSKAGAI